MPAVTSDGAKTDQLQFNLGEKRMPMRAVSRKHISLTAALLSFGMLALGIAGFPGRVSAQESPLLYTGPDREQKLIAGAKSEGEVMLYSAMIVNQAIRPLADAFMKKYPFIKVNYWRAESAGIFTKLSAEIRAGKVQADVVEGTGVGEAAVQAGFAQPYKTPMTDLIPERYRDPDSLWTPSRISYHGIGYNTKLVPPDQVPKTFEDLLDPRWKGKMVWHLGSSSGADLFVTNLRLKWGDDKTKEYLKKLATQNVTGLTGVSARALVDRVIAGEFALALNIFAHHPLISAKKGAPASSILMDPAASTVGTTIVPKGIKHPNAAMLLVDFMASKEGQTILARAGYFPVYPDIPVDDDIAPVVEAVKKVHEQFISPEHLTKDTPASEDMIKAAFGQ
jgi:ABC-type Fe3+ transport system substrate-binding protein